jgi:hypothetical protein
MEPFGRDLECAGVDDLGLHLLDARYPLEIPNGSPREATVDSKLLERYVGYYELAPTFILTVTRDGNQLYTQGTGQPRIANYGKSDREFFAKVVDAQITFQVDAQGQVTGLVLHQNGRDQSAKRIDAAEARQLEESVAKRFKDQTALPGSEAATRRLIDELQRGHVNYEQFTPEFALLARQNETPSEALINSLGSLQSLTFKGVGPGGFDIYEVKFDNGSVDWRISLAPDGKVAGIGFHKTP